MRALRAFIVALSLALVTVPGIAQAYIGPGVGAGAIAAALGVIGSILLAIFALVYYPIKRMRKKRASAKGSSATSG
ncbi:MAG: hypothetical protein AAF566_01865 [Pseudomonadota bacterium]